MPRIRTLAPIGCVHVTCESNGMAIIEKPFRQTIPLSNSFFFSYSFTVKLTLQPRKYIIRILYCILKRHRPSISVLKFVLFLHFFCIEFETRQRKMNRIVGFERKHFISNIFFCHSSNRITVVHSFSIRVKIERIK